MSILPLNIDYTSRDFDALKDRLQRGITTVHPTWTDFSAPNFGNILLECICFVGDVLAVYLDSHAREAFLSTCVKRISAQRHTRRMGYVMRGAEAAQVDLQFTLQQTYSGDVVFQQAQVVRTEAATDPARVQLLTDLLILAGNTTGTVSAENSITHEEVFDSDDTADQEFELTQTPFLEVVSITDATGGYAAVDSFLDSTSSDSHFQVLTSEERRGLIRFGDGRNGRVPAGEITVVYKTGGGQAIIEQGTLKIPEFSVTSSLGETVIFTVTNPDASSGGRDQETVEEARVNAPASIAAGNRSVNHEDFETNARRIAGVTRALMLTSDRYASLDENYGQLHLLSQGASTSIGYGPAVPTAAQLDAVKQLITTTYPPTLTFRFDTLGGTLKTIDVTATLYLREGATPATVDAAIRANLASFFSVAYSNGTPTTTVDFGYNYKDELGDPEPLVAWDDIFNIIKNTAGVRRLDEDAMIPTDDVTLLLYEFPALGDVTLINARTGLPLV